MDTTPSPKMFDAMRKLTDAVCGEEPHPMLVGSGAAAIRHKRIIMMDVLHGLVAGAMREGVNRAVKEAQQRRAGIRPVDAADRNAIAQAKHDAEAGVARTELKH